jgi:dolichol-phosphate mannosyltransferase
MRLSVLIPAKNEAANIGNTVQELFRVLSQDERSHEILVVNDHSEDQTEEVLNHLKSAVPPLRVVNNGHHEGFGNAIRYGLEQFQGDAVAIVMADGAEDPKDVLKCFQIMEEQGADCVFGSRFISGGQTFNYPPVSWFINRLANNLMSWLFGFPYNDFTNSFKLYKRSIIQAILPLQSQGFSITIELSLKAFNQTNKIAIPPIKWYSRSEGKSKFSLLKNIPGYLKVLIQMLFRRA